MMTMFEYLNESIHANPLVRSARDFGKKQHAGQTRKDGTPYFNHPARVARNVFKNKSSKKMTSLMAAAYGHDTVEDTDATIEDIERLFGSLVASIVGELTTDKKEMNKVGKTEYLIKKMLGMSDYALYIKLCDRLDNVSDLHTADEKFRAKYAKETNAIARALLAGRNLTSSQTKVMNKIQKKLYKLEHLNELS